MFAVPEHTVLRPMPSRPLSLAALVRSVAADASRWLEQLPAAGPRRVSMPSEDPRVELWLSEWLPEQPTALEHLAEQGAFAVISGQIVEHSISDAGERTTRTLQPGQVRVHGPGYRHSVANLGGEPAVTVHVRLRPWAR
jgi:mannose-6-phosphate isomerase-like protein (cupin superfamily)